MNLRRAKSNSPFPTVIVIVFPSLFIFASPTRSTSSASIYFPSDTIVFNVSFIGFSNIIYPSGTFVSLNSYVYSACSSIFTFGIAIFPSSFVTNSVVFISFPFTSFNVIVSSPFFTVTSNVTPGSLVFPSFISTFIKFILY